jgi:predicted component of type VI protein secretion system
MAFYLEIWTPSGMVPFALEGVRATLGRGEGNDIRVDDAQVSRSHAVLERAGSSWCIRDLSSSNGTFVNGTRISSERPLMANEEIRVGATRILYRVTGLATGRRTAGATSQGVPLLTPRELDVLSALCAPLLSVEPYPEPASTKDIAATLVVSEAAVRQHLLRLYDKFGIVEGGDRRRGQLAREALRLGAVGRDRS